MTQPFPRARLILNPSAGRGRTANFGEKLQSQLGPIAHSIEVFFSKSAEDLKQLAAKSRRDGVDLLIVAGGDGTVHHAARGILEEPLGTVPTLAILPLGSANDLAYALGLSDGWWQKPGWKVAAIDHGWIHLNQNPPVAFVNGVGMGLNAMVTIRSRGIHWLRGIPLYTAALLQSLLWDWRTRIWKVLVDSQPIPEVEDSCGLLALSVLNGRREGNFDLCPGARLDDGQFVVMAVRPMSRFRALGLLPSLITGSFGNGKGPIRMLEGTQITVESPEDIPCHADGELVSVPGDGINKLSIRLVSKGLPVVVGPGFSSS